MQQNEPPEHLSEAARGFWRDVLEDYALEVHHLRLLRAACESWDRAEEARQRIESEGAYFLDRFEQPKAHPAVDVERKSRDQFRMLIRELGLDVAPPAESRGPAAPANANRRR